MQGSKIKHAALIILAACTFMISGFAYADGNPASSEGGSPGVYQTVEQLAGKRIAVVSGTIGDSVVEKNFESPVICYANGIADGVEMVASGRADAFVVDTSSSKAILKENPDITAIDEEFEKAGFGAVFARNSEGKALRDEFNEWLSRFTLSGEAERLQEKWFESESTDINIEDYTAYPDTNGTLIMLTEPNMPPYEMVVNGQITGYEPELAAMFCKDTGRRLEITSINFSSILIEMRTGSADFAITAMTITPERSENCYFSDPYFYDSFSAIVLKAQTGDADEGISFFGRVVRSFEMNFIRENRWKMFLAGIGETMLITVLSIVFGSLLGFFLYVLCKDGNRAANTFARFFVWLITGMPVVVLLMILYYVVFGKTDMSGFWVSVIGFTLVFGAGTYGMLKTAVDAVDSGQFEAAYALGYSKWRAFTRMILPQAFRYFFPPYKGEIVSLIKSTSVVGYISVQDLTKMSDLVRSRTFDAFFPLVVTAIIYFILSAVLTSIVRKIELGFNPYRKLALNNTSDGNSIAGGKEA